MQESLSADEHGSVLTDAYDRLRTIQAHAETARWMIGNFISKEWRDDRSDEKSRVEDAFLIYRKLFGYTQSAALPLESTGLVKSGSLQAIAHRMEHRKAWKPMQDSVAETADALAAFRPITTNMGERHRQAVVDFMEHPAPGPEARLPRLQTHIRWIIGRDIPEVMLAEQECYEQPLMLDDILSRLQQRNCIGMVAEHDHTIYGYMLYELHTGHLKFLGGGVRPQYRRQGVGDQLMEMLLYKQLSHRRRHIEFLLRERNRVGQRVLKRRGIEQSRLLKKGYTEHEDGIEFWLTASKENCAALKSPYLFA